MRSPLQFIEPYSFQRPQALSAFFTAFEEGAAGSGEVKFGSCFYVGVGTLDQIMKRERCGRLRAYFDGRAVRWVKSVQDQSL